MRRLLPLIVPLGLGAAALGFVATQSTTRAAATSPQEATRAAVFAVFFDWDQTQLSPHALSTLAEATHAAVKGRAVRIALLAVDDSGAGRTRRAALARARWDNMQAELRRDGVTAEQIVRSGPSDATLRARPIALAVRMGAASAR